MAGERPGSAPPVAQAEGPPTVNLQIVSPSVGVGNLRFPDLPATTTVRQLRQHIRDTVPSHPADDQQRLIHRGRLVARDTDTLQDIFGEEAIRDGEQQTIHLVLRDPGTVPPPANPAPRLDPQTRFPAAQAMRNVVPQTAIPRPGSAPTSAPHAAPHHPHIFQPQPQQQQDLLQRITQLQQREAEFRQRLAQHQNLRATMTQQQHLHDRANGAQANVADSAGGRHSPVGQSLRTVTREGTGPDGQRYSFRITLNEVITQPGAQPGAVPSTTGAAGPTSDPVGHRPLSAADVRNIIHGADAAQAAQAMTNAMQRNAAGAAPANVAAGLAQFNFNNPIQPIQPIQPGVTTPIFPGLSRNASRAATPDLATRPVSRGNGVAPPPQQATAPGTTQAHATVQSSSEVYILNSPTGPRGLLIQNGSEMYTTPLARPLSWVPPIYRHPPPPFPQAEAHQGQGVQPQAYLYNYHNLTQHFQPPHPFAQQPPFQPPLMPSHTQPYYPPAPSVPQQPLPQPQNDYQQPPAIRRRPVAPPAAAPQPLQPAAAAPNPAAPAAAPPPANNNNVNNHNANHPANPGAGALVAALWPHVWLLIRLVAFTYWFSYTDPSWERWLSLVLALAVVFAINTGLFNNVVQQAFHPVREQLEGMMGPLEHERADGNNNGQQGGHGQGQQGGLGNPGQNQNHTGAGGGADAEAAPLDPAQAAARLVAQRRARNGTWLREQLRRVERAGILFLASFAPGVAERHIQQLEERERAERRAAEEARAAAAAAAAEEQARAAEGEGEAASAAAGQETGGGSGEEGVSATNTAEDRERREEEQQQQEQPRPQPPLVDV